MFDPIIKNKDENEPGFNMGVILSRSETKGVVGIEIEIEGKKLPKSDETPPPWTYTVDHSLRGEESGEYVLGKPIEFDGVEPALKKLWSKFGKMGTEFDDSNRTSVHVHLNCQSFFLNRLTSLAALYFIVEECLTEWCGDHRVGNLFCLRAKDAPGIISQMKTFIKYEGAIPLNEQSLHYAGLNAAALMKYGSMEIRSLRGCSDPGTILSWIKTLQRLYELSAEFTDPRDICARFSAEGPLSFFSTILGDMAPVIREGIPFNDSKIRDSMFEGIRLAQDICYCRNWEKYQAVDFKADPFGRDPRKLIKKLGLGTPPAPPGAQAAYYEPEPEYDGPDDEAEGGVELTMAAMNQASPQIVMNTAAMPTPVMPTLNPGPPGTVEWWN
jgi:hypothetical protein